MRKFDFDYLVIGSGVAGRTAALMAVNSGMKVGVVEAGEWGGESLRNWGIPYLVVSEVARNYDILRKNEKNGIYGSELSYNYPTMMRRKENLLRQRANIKKELEEAGVKCLDGFANFLDPHKVAVGEVGEISARKFLIATGSKIKNGKITHAKNVNLLTPSEVLNLERLPKTATVIGGGASGCEIAEYLAKLGVEVSLIEKETTLMPQEDKEIGQTLREYFELELNVFVINKANVQAVEQAQEIKKVIFSSEGKYKSIRSEAVILATGKQPMVDVGLENAGVKYDESGVKVNSLMRTNIRHIFAAGSVAQNNSTINSLEKSAHEAGVASANMINRGKNLVNYVGMTRRADLALGVASVGLTEEMCKARRIKYKTVNVKIDQTLIGRVRGMSYGFVKMIVDRNKKILGASVVAPQTDLVIQEISLAMRTGAKILDLAMTPHAMHDYAEMVKIAARELAQQ